MRKLGKLVSKAVSPNPFYHHLCYCHALHLAVQETFKRGLVSSFEEPSDGEYSSFMGFDSDEQIIETDSLEDPEEDDFAFAFDEDQSEIEEEGNSSSPVSKVRKICKEFKNTKKAGELARICPLRIQLDSPIRWNSTLVMLERFLEVECFVREIYQENGDTFPLQADDLRCVKFIVKILQHVKTAMLGLSQEKINLLDADSIIEVR